MQSFTIPDLNDFCDQILARLDEKLLARDKSNNSNDLLTVESACDLLQVSRSTIYDLTSSKKIPFSKKGRRCYFSKKELQAWIQSSNSK